MTTPLINQFEHTDPKTLQDFWSKTAAAIELSLLESGATPGTDFTYLDLYKLAQPIVLEQFKTGEIKL